MIKGPELKEMLNNMSEEELNQFSAVIITDKSIIDSIISGVSSSPVGRSVSKPYNLSMQDNSNKATANTTVITINLPILFICINQGIFRAFLCDPKNKNGFDDVNSIERLCDQYQIPFATNAATAEVLVQGLRRGDLDWRNIVNPQKR